MSRFEHHRLQREAQTVEYMIRIYCNAHHASSALCTTCEQLKDASLYRLEKCPYGSRKPACSRCRVHCYPIEERKKIRAVMRFAGWRMIWQHPILLVLHWWDQRRGQGTRVVPIK